MPGDEKTTRGWIWGGDCIGALGTGENESSPLPFPPACSHSRFRCALPSCMLTTKMKVVLVFAALLIVQATAHVCLLFPHQRGSAQHLDTPGEPANWRLHAQYLHYASTCPSESRRFKWLCSPQQRMRRASSREASSCLVVRSDFSLCVVSTCSVFRWPWKILTKIVWLKQL